MRLQARALRRVHRRVRRRVTRRRPRRIWHLPHFQRAFSSPSKIGADDFLVSANCAGQIAAARDPPPTARVMGKRAERKAFKKSGVDAAMSVGEGKVGGKNGGDGGWLVGNALSTMHEDDKSGADVSEAAAGGVKKAPGMGGRALTAGLQVRRKHGTVLRGITKRKNKLIAKGIAVADRKAGKLKKNTAKRGIREEGKGLY
jgi:hypothetical protein